MSGLAIYRKLYPSVNLFLENLRGVEIHKNRIPQPTPWAIAAVNSAFCVNKLMEGGTVVVDEETILHIDEFASNLTDYYALRWNRLMLQLIKDFGLSDEFGECVAQGLIHWAETGFLEAEPFWKAYKNFASYVQMAKESLVQLAHTYHPDKHSIGGWYASTKLDGMRVIWDGGVSRGLPKEDVPWANMLKDVTPNQLATGLWSRYGNVIHAPDWFLNALPPCPLDGEGYIGNRMFERTMSIMKDLPANRSDEDWKQIKYKVFNFLPPEQFLKPRIINETNFKKTIKDDALLWWRTRFAKIPGSFLPKGRTFNSIYGFLKLKIPQNEVVEIHPQVELPMAESLALEKAEEMMAIILETHGEGLILRRGCDQWIPERVHELLKMKPWYDGEATVIGYTTGDLTELGSKYLGMMGAVICQMEDGKTFKVSGFTDEERYLSEDARAWAIDHPAHELPEVFASHLFPRGTVITYKYRELTKAGVPKEARYLRKYIG